MLLTHKKELSRIRQAYSSTCSIPHLGYIQNTPLGQLRDRDFLKLKSGRDSVTNLRPMRLKEMVAPKDLVVIQRHFPYSPSLALQAIRWHVRGLNVYKAVRLVQVHRDHFKR